MTFAQAPDTIVIEELDIECVIGLYEHERNLEQRLIVSAELSVDTRPAALRDALELTVDYVWVTDLVTFLLKAGKFQLLETAAHVLCQVLLLPPLATEQRCAIDAVSLKLRKPAALGGRGLPTLHVRRRASDSTYRRETTEYGTCDVLYESPRLTVHRLLVARECSLVLKAAAAPERAYFALSDGFVTRGTKVARGSVFVGSRSVTTKYENPTQDVRTLLCVG